MNSYFRTMAAIMLLALGFTSTAYCQVCTQAALTERLGIPTSGTMGEPFIRTIGSSQVGDMLTVRLENGLPNAQAIVWFSPSVLPILKRKFGVIFYPERPFITTVPLVLDSEGTATLLHVPSVP